MTFERFRKKTRCNGYDKRASLDEILGLTAKWYPCLKSTRFERLTTRRNLQFNGFSLFWRVRSFKDNNAGNNNYKQTGSKRVTPLLVTEKTRFKTAQNQLQNRQYAKDHPAKQFFRVSGRERAEGFKVLHQGIPSTFDNNYNSTQRNIYK